MPLTHIYLKAFDFMHPTTAIIDLAALSLNYRQLQELAKNAETAAVVKANGYGLGLEQVGKELFAAGCRTFFVAYFCEGERLRQAVPEANIAVLGGLEVPTFKESMALGLTPVLNSLGALQDWATFARQNAMELPAIIHLDTGMNRLGLSITEQKQLSEKPDLMNGLHICAYMTHCISSEEFDSDLTPVQREKFLQIVRQLPPAPLSMANSSCLFWGKDFHFDLVRPGVALFGGNPTPQTQNPMHNVLTVQTKILQIREVDAGMTVGYGATHRFEHAARVATLAIGYADGFHRSFGPNGSVLIGTHSAPIIGRVSMDLITIDVTHIPESLAHPGGMATLIGAHRPIDAVANEAGTIAYEVLTSLGQRVTRQYLNATSLREAA